MFVFRKIWGALFSWNTRFEIRPFALQWNLYKADTTGAKKGPLYRDIRFIEIFSKIVWLQSKAIRSSPYCRLIEVFAL